MIAAHIDFETRSAVDLPKTGVDVYASHPSTDVWCMAWSIGDDPVQVWTPGDPAPGELLDHIMLGGIVMAHNAAFERVVWHHIMVGRYGWPAVDLTQWRCTMIMARELNLPGSLEAAAPAAGVDVAKDMVGRRLMLQMSKPRKIKFSPKALAWQKKDERDFDVIFDKCVSDGAPNGEGWQVFRLNGELFAEIQWWNEADKLARLIDYCKIDVEVERKLEKKLLALPATELSYWQLDQIINDRGVLVDRDLANAARQIVATAQRKVNEKLSKVTDTEVTAATNTNQIITFLKKEGVDTDTIAKDAVEELLAPDSGISSVARQVLNLRREASKASVSKINALLLGTSPRDGRARGLLQFYAASTGRWGGRRFQPQNLKRPEEADIDALIEAIAGGDHDYVEMMYGSPINAVSDILRGLIIAAPGYRILAADYSNIEGRVLAWLAGEDWKVDAFREFDEGIGPDLYIKSYAETFNVPIFGKKDPRRQIGKVMELASGYQGGHGAYLRFGLDDEKKLGELTEIIQAAATDDEWEVSAKKYTLGAHGLRREHWTALRIVIDRWRAKHSNVASFWYEMEEAAINAVRQPGVVQKVGTGKIAFKMAGTILHMRLPSGRCLRYPYPEIRAFEVPWKDADGNPATKAGLTYKTEPDVSKKARIVDDPTNSAKFARIKTYGGALVENATQAVARDVLAYAMPRLEEAGYPITLTVHDEIVCEVPDGHGSIEAMEKIMCELPDWAAGLPVAAEGFDDVRYRK
jgi:DNA polymerase